MNRMEEMENSEERNAQYQGSRKLKVYDTLEPSFIILFELLYLQTKVIVKRYYSKIVEKSQYKFSHQCFNNFCSAFFQYLASSQNKINIEYQSSRTMIGRAEQYNSILRKVLQAGTDVFFAVMFERPNNIITLYRQHIYSLFLLLFFCGQEKHKQYIINRLQLCIEEQKKQLKVCQNMEKEELNKNSFNFEAGSPKQKDSSFSKANKIIETQIKCLEIVKKQVLRLGPGLNYQFNMHSTPEREILKKGLVMMLTMEKKNFFLKDVSFFDLCKTAAEIIGISCSIKNYLDFYIVQFHCSQFEKRNLLVYIQINKQLQTYKYIKQKDFLDADLIISQTSHLIQSSFRSNQIKNISLQNSSFFNLLREQTSFLNDEQNIIDPKLMKDHDLGGQEAQSRQIQQSGIYQQSAVVEQSIVLQQSRVIEQSMVLENNSVATLGFGLMQKKKKSEDNSCCNESFVTQFKASQNQQQQKKQKQWQPPIPICEEQIQKEENSSRQPSENCSIKVSLVKKDKQISQQNTQAGGMSTFSKTQSINSKSLVVPGAFKRERERKSSDTIHQNLPFSEEECSFQSFVESMNQNNTMLTSNQNFCNNQVEISMNMLQSKTTPFLQGEDDHRSLKTKKQPATSSIQQLVKMVKSGQTKFDSQLLKKFSFVQMVEALDYLETEQQYLQFEEEKQRQYIIEQNKKIDIVSILTAILRQQNYGRISDFIQNARKALNIMSVNAQSILFNQKEQLDIEDQEKGTKYNQKSEQRFYKIMKRGEQTLKFPFSIQNGGQQKRKEICELMVTGKLSSQSGSPIKHVKMQQKVLSKSRILDISTIQNEEGLNLKCSKIFSPERKLQ